MRLFKRKRKKPVILKEVAVLSQPAEPIPDEERLYAYSNSAVLDEHKNERFFVEELSVSTGDIVRKGQVIGQMGAESSYAI
ncbi:MAG: hypothetical protein DRJ29_16225 [Bacteroidetes bacterium]|nr:MAG: hypothetical protein DRJ29_16225 [Bacteroidota bacterium]